MTRRDVLAWLCGGPRCVGWPRDKTLADLEVQATQGPSAMVNHMNAVEDLLRYIGDPDIEAAYRRVPVPKMTHEAQRNYYPTP